MKKTWMHNLKQGSLHVTRALIKTKYRRKISKMMKLHPHLNENHNEQFDARIDAYWNDKLGMKISKKWHYAYSSVNGIADERYIPEDVYYSLIEPKLNRRDLSAAYVDKNSYSCFLSRFHAPRTLLKNKNGIFLKHDVPITPEQAKLTLLDFEGDFFIKPSIGNGGGKVVKVVECRNRQLFIRDKRLSFEQLISQYGRDFIIQERLDQHASLKEIYPLSLNTVRMMTIRHRGNVKVLSALVRFGNNGNYINNIVSGGLSCRVDGDGILNHFAIDKSGKKYERHPFTKLPFGGTVIPNYAEVQGFVMRLHRQLSYFDMVSWDIGIDRDAVPNLIELNLTEQEINVHQFNSGPLFREFTEDIMKEKILI